MISTANNSEPFESLHGVSPESFDAPPTTATPIATIVSASSPAGCILRALCYAELSDPNSKSITTEWLGTTYGIFLDSSMLEIALAKLLSHGLVRKDAQARYVLTSSGKDGGCTLEEQFAADLRENY